MTECLTIVLVPGLLCNARLWAPQIEPLRAFGNVVVADLTTQQSIGEMAESVLSLADGPLAIVGLSMGGYVAMEAALLAPDRVRRLALLDTRATLDDAGRVAARRQMLESALQGKFAGVTRRLLPSLVHPDRLSDDRLTGEIMTMAREVGRDAFVRQTRAIMHRRDFRAELHRIGCRTLAACGREDCLTPVSESALIADALPNACLETFERCGHLSTIERPDAVNDALERLLNH